eukprot:TRINITY_DN17877_c0_g2_i1.p1 TRINITY_DN17877_c0_g2~~TRINITY_DN17877_c0_g2_i1.p1  ORF type:complete len:315 (+),score=33.12 TRINITY_DN17877_c0_g2_i1:96-1040(+)
MSTPKSSHKKRVCFKGSLAVLNLDLGKSKLLKQKEADYRRYVKSLCVEENKLVVYDANAVIVYKDSEFDDSSIEQPKKEKSLFIKKSLVQKEQVWEWRVKKLRDTLAPEERNELDQAFCKIPHKPFPEYVYNTSILVPHTLRFSSHFECANLQRAVLVGGNQYDLTLRPDTGTQSYSQWFYFCVYNTSKGQTVRFNLINLRKNLTSYSNGMTPTVWSINKERHEGIKWHKAGTEVTYKRNSLDPAYYTLSFSYTFEHSNDCVYFAHAIPYSYSKLCRFIARVKTRKQLLNVLSLIHICRCRRIERCRSRWSPYH